MLVCAAAFLGIGASVAGAATPGQSYAYTGDIGTPDGGFISTGFTNVVAVSNDNGNVFIVRQRDPDTAEGAVDILDPTTSMSIARPSTGSFQPGGVAVSADGSYFFVLDAYFGTEVQKYHRTSSSPLAYSRESWSPSVPLSSPQGIAVDPSTGDLLLSDGKVKRFNSATGELRSTIDGSASGSGTFTGPGSLAAGPNGDFYVVDLSGRVLHFATDDSFKGSLPIPDQSGMAVGVAVNPQNGDVAVELTPSPAVTDTVIRIFSATNVPKDVIRVPPARATEEGSGQNNNTGLAFSPDGSKLYIGLRNGNAHVYSRGTQSGVDAPVAADITPSGAHLSANVATGGESTTAWIEYCLATEPCERNLTSEDPSPWHRLTEHSGLATPQPEQDMIEDDATGLEPNTKYLLRTYAVNEGNGVENRSATATLNTAVPPPLVTTADASDLSDTSAQLVGSVDNTFGGQTTFHFEYGLTTDYGSRVPTGADGIAGNLRTPRTFSRLVAGLQPGTTYHFRLVATNSGGTTAGADRTFTTLGIDEVAPQRFYEQVTPVNKNGLSLQVGYGIQVAADGSGFEYATTSPSSDALSAAVVQRYVAWRGTSDWIDALPLDPPFHPSRAVVVSPTLAVSNDFRRALVISQYALAPGATEGDANFYVRDLENGAYSFVGSSAEPGAFIGTVGTTQQDKFIAGAPDFSWVVFNSAFRLLPGAPKTAMYKWTESGGLSLLSLLPGDAAPDGVVRLQGSTQVSNRFVSDDGEAAVFSLRDGNDGVYRRSAGQTEEVSVGEASGGPIGIQPAVADGLSSDGRYVVFHSGSQLTDDDTDGTNSEYRYDASTGQMEYLGPQDVSSGDGALDVPWIGRDGKTVYFNSEGHLVAWREGQGVDVASPTPVRGGSFGSPNGRYFAFGAPDRSVRLYDADAGESTCLSCAAGGMPQPGGLADGERNISNQVPQVVTDDGHAYFTTAAALLSADRNAANDVYEYFRGRLTLISPGDADFSATLAGISADGSDVFFTTAQGLVSRDTDGTYDIYDARIGGGFAAQNPPPPPGPCTGDACQGAGSSPPAVATPGSLGSDGDGNAKPRRVHCAKNKRRVTRNGKSRCVKKKPHHNKKRHAKHNRGTGR
ncbi:MAG: hypothetical protein ACJ75T_07970 [Solirubrobacterales bacterium]